MKSSKLNKTKEVVNPKELFASFIGEKTIEKAGELAGLLAQPVIKSSDTGISLRNLHHWVSTLAINENREASGWRKFTFSEFVWLKMIEQLREAGLSIPVIVDLKKDLFEPFTLEFVSSKEAQYLINKSDLAKEEKEKLLHLFSTPDFQQELKNTKVYLLDLMIVQSIIRREPLGLAVFLDGSFLPLEINYLTKYDEADIQKLFNSTYVHVSISGIIKDFLLSEVSDFLLPKIGIKNLEENKLLEYVNSGEYQSITIHFRNKKMKSLELKKSESVEKKINEVLKKNDFSEILITKHKGKIAKIENTVKIKL